MGTSLITSLGLHTFSAESTSERVLKSVNIWQSYGQDVGCSVFLDSRGKSSEKYDDVCILNTIRH